MSTEKRRPGRPAVDFTGLKFGSLLPIERVSDPHRPESRLSYWVCYCTEPHFNTGKFKNTPEGRRKVVAYSSLHQGRVRSCGCMSAHRKRGPKRDAGAPMWVEAQPEDYISIGLEVPSVVWDRLDARERAEAERLAKIAANNAEGEKLSGAELAAELGVEYRVADDTE